MGILRRNLLKINHLWCIDESKKWPPTILGIDRIAPTPNIREEWPQHRTARHSPPTSQIKAKKKRTIYLRKKTDIEGIKAALTKYSERFFASSFNSVDNMWQDIKGVIDQEITDHVPTKHTADRHTHQGSGKLEFFRSQTKIQKLGLIWNSQKPKKSVPYWPNTKEIFSDSVRYLGFSQILNLPSSDVNPLITHD